MDTSQSLLTTVTIAAASIVLVNKLKREKRRPRIKPAYRVNPYLAERNLKGRYTTDFHDMTRNPRTFNENFHMTSEQFEALFKLVEFQLTPKRNTRPNDAIPPKLKLAIVLEYLASGDVQRHMASCYRVSKHHFGTIIDQVCDAIRGALKNIIPAPTKESFIETANSFNTVWNFPNCIGAIDGKHVSIKAPPNAGSIFYNYKGFHSLALLAICDARYRFTYLDIGAYGSEGDCNIFKNSIFGSNILNDRLCFPDDSKVNGTKLPFYFVGDDAFPLCKRLMKPYSLRNMTEEEQIYNYRLSRARLCIENAFGLLCSKWACLKKTLFCGPDRAQKVIVACTLLHNFLISNKSTTYCSPTYMDRIGEDGRTIEGEWRKRILTNENSMFHTSIPQNAGRNTDYGKYIRNKIKEYVNSQLGELPWQRRAAFVE